MTTVFNDFADFVDWISLIITAIQHANWFCKLFLSKSARVEYFFEHFRKFIRCCKW